MKKQLSILGASVLIVGGINAQTTLNALKTKIQAFTNTIQNQSNQNFKKSNNLQISSTGYYLPGVEVHYQFDTVTNNWKAPHDSVVKNYYAGWPNEGKLKEEIHHGYNNFSNTWDPQNKTYNNYNNNGLLVSTIFYGYSNPNWSPNNRDTFIYNSNNKLIEERWEMWDSGINNWGATTSKNVYTYNAANKLIVDEFYQIDWSTNTLIPNSKTTYSYNSVNQPTLELHQDWESATSTYTNNSKMLYKYNSSGQLNSVYMFSYDAASNSWDTMARVINISWYKWLSSDLDLWDYNLLSSYEWQLRMGNGIYLPVFKVQITYDPLDDAVLSEDYFSWSSGNWVKENGSTQYNYTRNTSLNNMITESIQKGWFKHLNSYRNEYKISYRNPQFMTSIKNYDNSIDGYIIYPNPSSDQLYISISNLPMNEEINVKIINLQGQELVLQKVTNNQSINVSDLSNGIYILNIETSNGKMAQTKFVKN